MFVFKHGSLSIAVFAVIALALSHAVAMTVNFTGPVVDTVSGSLRGVQTSVNGHPLLKFLGVPYAQPPVGPLRFKAPVPLPVPSASISIDATSFRPSCMQPPHLRRVIYRPLHQDLDESLVSEDCLYLNIYVPRDDLATLEEAESENGQKLAVMIWLPGEGFDFGYANQYDGSLLATRENVIVVTVNYRLSAFGFLSTGDSEAPGNIGLRDQVQALRWLRDHIGSFGGDPDRMTPFGRLTGSISASALLTSPHIQEGGKTLFRRTILQSGVAKGDWIYEKNPLEQTTMLASRLNCSSSTDSTSSAMLDCLRQVPAQTLLMAAIRSPRPWRLVLDDDFLPKTPLSVETLAPNVDVMIGANEHEGSLCLLTHLAQKTEYMDKMLDNNFTSGDLHSLMKSHVEDYYRTNANEGVHATAKLQYRCSVDFSEESVTPSTSITTCREQFLTFCGDLYIHSAVSTLANKLADQGNIVYRYEFTHRPNFSHYPEFVGAAQGDEVLFIFGLVENPSLENVTKDEIKLSHQMMTAWSNFAKTGNPNPIQRDLVWPRYTANGKILDIAVNMGPQSIRWDPHRHRLIFWEQVGGGNSS